MNTAIAPKHWTYDDYLQLSDEIRYEILEGDLAMAPAPDSNHQITSMEVEFPMETFVRTQKLGIVLHAPIDVILSKQVVLQPDILFVSKERREIVQKRGVFGAPDIVIEIVSPGSVQADRYRKKDIYQEHGVREYWIIDPRNKSIEIFALTERGYELHSIAEESGIVESIVLAGFTLDIEPIFQQLID
ncbi:MAG: Uma2 family endonuclease [Chlorobi bacterium]|nr:MAG: hypothetical protein UZ07_CHB004002421 [Chlorobi bacterium OLB7]MBK8912079.1 Uma2 family endonuclease [Chlorobiota bacterium]MBX7217146.1 Uma2 family endonuclease [Candidatus Kapabacteria bacterium]